MSPQPRLRITFENHNRIYTNELPFDASLPEIIQKFCHMLEANGWSRENIVSLFQDDGDNNNPFEWEV